MWVTLFVVCIDAAVPIDPSTAGAAPPIVPDDPTTGVPATVDVDTVVVAVDDTVVVFFFIECVAADAAGLVAIVVLAAVAVVDVLWPLSGITARQLNAKAHRIGVFIMLAPFEILYFQHATFASREKTTGFWPR